MYYFAFVFSGGPVDALDFESNVMGGFFFTKYIQSLYKAKIKWIIKCIYLWAIEERI